MNISHTWHIINTSLIFVFQPPSIVPGALVSMKLI